MPFLQFAIIHKIFPQHKKMDLVPLSQSAGEETKLQEKYAAESV